MPSDKDAANQMHNTLKALTGNLPMYRNPTEASIKALYEKDWGNPASLNVYSTMVPPAVADILKKRVKELDSWFGISKKIWIYAILGIVLLFFAYLNSRT